MNLLFTVCGRAGSKGFKNKNLKEMNGVPLIYYTIASIKLYMDRHPDVDVTVGINTDSIQLINIVQKQHMLDNICFVERKDGLSGDFIAKVDVIQDTYHTLKKEKGFDAVIDLDITSPLRRVSDIENAIKIFHSNSSYDLVFSVVEARRSPYFNMVEKKDNYYRKICASDYTARQEAPKSYELNASIYVYNSLFLDGEIKNTILDNRCGISVMEDYLVLDIDSEKDFRMMEFLHKYFCRNDTELNEIYVTAKSGI